MTKSEQFLVYLTPVHKAALRAEAERTGLSMNAVVQGMIEHHCRTPELRRYLRAQEVVAGMNGLRYVAPTVVLPERIAAGTKRRGK